VNNEMMQQEFDVETLKLGEEREGLEKDLESAERMTLVEERSDYSGKGKGKETSEVEELLTRESQEREGSENVEGDMGANEGGGPSQLNHPKPCPKRKATNMLNEDQLVNNTEAKTSGPSVQSRPLIPMMTVPPKKEEKGAPKQAALRGGEEDDKGPEGPVGYQLIHFTTNTNLS
jgi:hypothetical protein